MSEYDLQAEGLNGTNATTYVAAIQGSGPSFNGAVLLVDASQAPHQDAWATSAIQGTTMGVPGSSVSGVLGSCDISGVGVSGIAGSTPTPMDIETAGTGVVGLGSWGVFGGGPVGVVGASSAGVGVKGVAGPHGVVPTGGAGVGVLGIGSIYGGVFGAAPSGPETAFANMQLTPLEVDGSPAPLPPFKSKPILPGLPRDGQPGDILSLIANSDPQGVRLWVCVKPAATGHGATWARLSFDAMVVTM